MLHLIQVAVLDDHQSVIDGYLFRLSKVQDIAIIGSATVGEELEPMLISRKVDVLLLDISVPTSTSVVAPFPILHEIPKLLERYPSLHILVISMYKQRALVQSVIDAGASGYILKDDRESIRNLDSIIRLIASGSIFFSPQLMTLLMKNGQETSLLSKRQLEAVSLCAAYPDESTGQLAKRLNVEHSTFRNLLSNVYIRLDVRSRTAAVDKARQLAIITPLEEQIPE